MDFGLPQTGQYWVIGLDPHYRFAVVSDPSRRSLYILSKTPALDSRFYNEALRQASQQVSTAGLVMTVQNGCKYPWERR